MPSMSNSWSKPGIHRSVIYGITDGVPFNDTRFENVNVWATGSQVRISNSTPGFGRANKYKKGTNVDLPMNPFVFARSAYSGAEGNLLSITKNLVNGNFIAYLDDGQWDSNLTGLSIDPDETADLDNSVASKMLEGLKDQSVNLGVVVGEGRQTIDLFTNTAKRLAGAARDLRRGDLIGAASNFAGVPPSKAKGLTFSRNLRKNGPSALSNGWLELQYGWKPLLSDIYGACEHLANQLYRPPRFKLSKSKTKVANATVRSVGSHFSSDFDTIDSWETSHTIKYVIYYTQEESHSLSSLGLINPLSIAWELVPWSFVADWFLPIGNYLNNLDATHGLHFVKGCKTEFWKASKTRRYVGKSRTEGNTLYETHATLRETVNQVVCTRTRLTAFPSVPIPSFKNPFSPYHIANASALVQQAFHGNSRGRGF